jgi:hypothetical protein
MVLLRSYSVSPFQFAELLRSGRGTALTALGFSWQTPAHHGKSQTLFSLCIRGSRGGGARNRGLLRRGGPAVCGIRGAAGYQRNGNGDKI